jgi:uracil-DNA glycosylase
MADPDRAYQPVVSAAAVERHLALLRACERCPSMHRPAIAGRATPSRILLVGQAPGDKEPKLGRPFAWTAGKTLFRWFWDALGWSEADVRNRIYMAAVCRCFPGKNPRGGDRVPDGTEIAACSDWLVREFALLRPALVLPVGKLAIQQFMPVSSLADVIGKVHRIDFRGFEADCIPMPHPSGASTWHRMEPGRSLLNGALRELAEHPALEAAGNELR